MIVSEIAVVYCTYVVATASPGPSNMAIMTTAMREGRLPALVLAAGVITGSLFWAVLAATGMSAMLASSVEWLFAIRIAGGVYLLYLAFRTGRSAFHPKPRLVGMHAKMASISYSALYRQGIMMHVSNPKAALAWIAIMSLGLGINAPYGTLVATIGGCSILGVIVFGGYAIIFSTDRMVALYACLRRWIEGAISGFFAAAGWKLLFSPT